MSLTNNPPYSPEAEAAMRNIYNCLGEKERRWFAGGEAIKLPYGGIRYIAGVLGCCENTVVKGMEEIATLGDGDPLPGRERAKGAGRPKKR